MTNKMKQKINCRKTEINEQLSYRGRTFKQRN